MLSQERSFNRLCALVREAPDDEHTATELNEVLNDLYGAYSELEVIRGLARRLGRSNGALGRRQQASGRGSRDRTGKGDDVQIGRESSNERVEPVEGRSRSGLKLVGASSGAPIPNHSG